MTNLLGSQENKRMPNERDTTANNAAFVNRVYSPTNNTNVDETQSSRSRPATSIGLNDINLSDQPEVAIVTPNRMRSSRAAISNNASSGISSVGRQSSSNVPIDENELEEEEEELKLKYGASHVIKLFIPVTLCMLFVILTLSCITSYRDSGGAHLIYTPFNEESEKSSGTKLWMSVANASIFIGVVVFMTIVLILLYKFHCYKIIHGWLAFSSLMLLFLFTYMFISEIFKTYNLVTDMFTISIFLWNFGLLGMVCIHWKGPLILQQAFLIFTCVQMALIFIKYLAEWTTWVLLAFISIWDLIAVLCPFGPLRILVETAKSRNDSLFPAMVYSSTLMYTLMAKPDDKKKEKQPINNKKSPVSTSNYMATGQNENIDRGFGEAETNIASVSPADRQSQSSTRNRHPSRPANEGHIQETRDNLETMNTHQQHIEQLEQQQQEEEENGVKLGLGDFIFYSILVGKASILGDWNTVIACFIAILIGLCLTLVLLAIYHKALPALPISLLFGLIFYFLTNLVVRPFYDNLTAEQVFI